MEMEMMMTRYLAAKAKTDSTAMAKSVPTARTAISPHCDGEDGSILSLDIAFPEVSTMSMENNATPSRRWRATIRKRVFDMPEMAPTSWFFLRRGQKKT